jgi:cytochrome P450/NADPH-cytochrome P450 reductase
MDAEKSLSGGLGPPLMVRAGGSDRSLPPGPSYLIGRDPECDFVVADASVSWHHAVLRLEGGRWVLTDNGSTNGTYVRDRRVDRVEIDGECLVRLGPAADAPVLSCTVSTTAPALPGLVPTEPAPPVREAAPPVREPDPVRSPGDQVVRIGRAPDNDLVVPDPSVSGHHAELRTSPGGYQIVDLGSLNGTFVNEHRVTAAPLHEGDVVGFGTATFRLAGADLQAFAGTGVRVEEPPPPPVAVTPAGEGLLEIPYAVRWLVPRGERFANFPILNDNDTQLEYFRRFGHIYAVGIPAKKWRLVMVSDPELLDEVAANEEQFGKRVEEINFFAQLANSRGGGISVIGDGAHYEQVRRVMLPWYSPQHQRTQLERMKDQARKLVAVWAALPAGEPLDARAWMERYTLEVSGRGACAYDFGLLGGSGCPHPFAAAVPASTKESILRVAEPRPDFTVLAGRARRARVQAYRQHNEELFRTADALVRGRAHTTPLGQQTDLLSRLLSTPDPETGQFLDHETIRDQILMHLSNGFNGPSITGAWLAYILGTRPDVEEKVLAEIDQITGGDPDYDLQYDDLAAMTYTTQVIKETLRIYPPLPVTIRRSLKDGRLGRYRIRKGDTILVGSLAAQRDPRYWGPDPDRFDPQQFAPDKVIDRPRHAMIPFSIGRRQCMAQEVTFMMLRVVVFEIGKHYRLRLAPGMTVTKNTVVSTKPVAVPVILLPRQPDAPRPAPAVRRDRPQVDAPAIRRDWGEPTEIPESSAYRHLVIAYGSNFGANKELAGRFAERSDFHGYTSDVITLNELAESPPTVQPWLLVVMTSTYTSNPPSNAAAFKSWLEHTEPGGQTWRNCRYLVWGLGNSQWNAFLAFPRYVQAKLSELGATPLADLAYGDVGTPAWERLHADWNSSIWPVLLELSGARPTQAAAARDAAERAAAGALTGTDSHTAMQMSLHGDDAAPRQASRARSITSIMRLMSPGSRRAVTGTQQRVLLAPTILTNAVGIDTVEARAQVCRELQAGESPKRTRHQEVSLPPGVAYQVGDHLGICPKNDEEQVERLARHLGVALDSLFMAPSRMNIHAVPKGVVLQVRNVLTNLVDITGRPTVPLLDLLLEKAADPDERSRLAEIRSVLQTPDGPHSPLRAPIDAGGYDVLRLLDAFPSCSPNLFEFLLVAQPLRPRYYSISSSPRISGAGVAHVTVGLETTPVPGLPGHDFRGMSSHYMHALREGDRLNVFVDSAARFHLQDDVTKPMIFVSAGTGFAPMRAFLWERLAMKNAGVSLAEAALFNGIRSSSLDYIYRDEIEQFTADGVLDHVHVAMSRERPGCRDYIQDRIREQGALIWRLLAAGGYVYICGSRPMRDAVRGAFVDVAAEQGRLPHEPAEAYLHELETTARYRPDLWG